MLQGARQVGKTHSLQWLGTTHYKRTVYCNFEQNKRLHPLFSDADPEAIVQRLRTFLRTEIDSKETLIIFDEVQECSQALNSLKYFQEQANHFHIAAAGSLLGVKLGHHDSFPVGKVNFLHMYPLSFAEYLSAIGEDRFRTILDQKEDFQPLNEGIHLRLIELLRRYLVLGGMPEVIGQSLVRPGSVLTEVQNEILKSYELDFVKHATPAEAMKVSQVWNQVPSQLSKENRKFVFSAVRKSARGRDFEGALRWLSDAGLIYQACAVSKPELPLAGLRDPGAFKIYVFDVGLLSAMAGLDPAIGLSGTNIFSEFKGAITENYVAQQLATMSDGRLYYWRSENIAEVDFIHSEKQRILPLEVKAGINARAKSLRYFGNRYSISPLYRTNLMNFNFSAGMANVPLYAIHRLQDLTG
ncbi:MAG: ATP-binding protein [Deltaproteobacteria bacterium]|nr:ATP-binding protein [Deltaproteobacteria bacterium]MBI3293249.1 ATP-binding protein [Deltaproteobacteria bacterium]